MEIEQIRDTAINLRAWKYKIKAIGGIIIAIIVMIVGIVFTFSNVITGIIILIAGLIIGGLSYLSFRSSRKIAEIEGGMHGTMAQHRLRNLRRRMKK